MLRPSCRQPLVALLLLTIGLVAACSAPASRVPPPPPAETLFVDAAEVAAQRASKDRQFRTLDDSPLLGRGPLSRGSSIFRTTPRCDSSCDSSLSPTPSP